MNTPKFKERRYLTPQSISSFLKYYHLNKLIDAYDLVETIGLAELANATPEVLYHVVVELFKCDALPSPTMPNETSVTFWMRNLAKYCEYVFEQEQVIRYSVHFNYIDPFIFQDSHIISGASYYNTEEEARVAFNDLKRKWYLRQELTPYAPSERITDIHLSVHRVVDGISDPAIWEFHDERKKE